MSVFHVEPEQADERTQAFYEMAADRFEMLLNMFYQSNPYVTRFP